MSILSGHLVLRDVPYLDEHRRVRRGMIAAPLRLSADRTLPPSGHQVYFVGMLPFGADGRPLIEMLHQQVRHPIGRGIVAEHMLCSRPVTGEFPDYHQLMTTFVAQVANPAAAVDPSATARRSRIVTDEGESSPFAYIDTASSRAGIAECAERLSGQRVAIVGLGGTGSYVLDLVAKTSARRIHLFDDDLMEQHNAFRAPGAASTTELGRRPRKVEYFDSIYSKMHRGVVPHAMRLSSASFPLLEHVDFVFLCIDAVAARRTIVAELERRDLPFIDVGMGLHVTKAGVVGTVRVTTSTPQMRSHVRNRDRIPMSGEAGDDPYATNVQIADLNMLNAALAVLRWKRWSGFYADFEGEHFSTYTADGNHLLNEDFRPTKGKPI